MYKRRVMGIGMAVLAALLLLSVPDESVAGAHLIYERIGYQSGVETLVDSFLANVAGDSVCRPRAALRVNGRFADTDMAQLRGHLIDQVCEATDGPCTYTGKSMREAHAGMGITEAEFAIIAGHFAAAMEQAGVSKIRRTTPPSWDVLSAMQDDIVYFGPLTHNQYVTPTARADVLAPLERRRPGMVMRCGPCC